MKRSIKPQKIASDLGIDPEKIDFNLDEKELENVSGGTQCGKSVLVIPTVQRREYLRMS